MPETAIRVRRQSEPLSARPANPRPSAQAHFPAWAGLLERCYARAALPRPPLVRVRSDAVPEPCKTLLVHSLDMTPTLEKFYRQPLRLQVLSRERQDGSYFREVVLRLGGDWRPVEYGAIRIFLAHLPAVAAQRVLEEERPLGDILRGEAVPHLSWPQAFFFIEADAHLSALLGVRRPACLYGRRNVLLDARRRLLAEVIEILPPAQSSSSSIPFTAKGQPDRSRSRGRDLDAAQPRL